MGLSISVGPLGVPEAEVLRRGLAAVGVGWREPGGVGQGFSAGFPYSYLGKLRRVYVLHRVGEPVTGARQVDAERFADELALVEDETYMFDSHLLCHSDCEGYYVPLDLVDPLFLSEESEVPGGGMVGSSGALLGELQGFAGAIGVRLTADGVLGAAESARLAALPADDPFEPEVFAWHQLYQACRASLAGGWTVAFG
ncbi:hypothetical protein C7C46_16715 [Streptomyces tateyamensis]|uniref:Uncharacterized protein n=1 Tax=Streptomyces tateyamensis TaxID=565073 RepID=A0A2V4NCX3_9ACTN|nr:hypothetical protein [Streptomyces tateyamensis]PYC77989.1 hypothetical protein C7C46_16715 [Streptomyces tateyamensis]